MIEAMANSGHDMPPTEPKNMNPDATGISYSRFRLMIGFYFWMGSMAIAAIGSWLPERHPAASADPPPVQ